VSITISAPIIILFYKSYLLLASCTNVLYVHDYLFFMNALVLFSTVLLAICGHDYEIISSLMQQCFFLRIITTSDSITVSHRREMRPERACVAFERTENTNLQNIQYSSQTPKINKSSTKDLFILTCAYDVQLASAIAALEPSMWETEWRKGSRWKERPVEFEKQ